MQKKEITINGKTYTVAFDMQTMMNFETVTKGKSFFDSNFKILFDKISLIVAAVLTSDEKADITIEDVMGKKDWDTVKQIIAAFAIVSELMDTFFDIPEIEKQDEPQAEAKEDEDAKN